MIIFLYGEDNFRSAEKLKQLKDDFFKKNTSNATSSVFDFSDGQYWERLKTAIKAKGLFSENSLVIVKNLLTQESFGPKDDPLKFFADNCNDSNSLENIIIFWEDGKVKKNNKIFKWLIKNAKCEEFTKLGELQLRKWVERRFAIFNIDTKSIPIENLINNKKGDLVAIDNEILKIINFIGKDGIDKNSSDQITKLINSSTEANIFQTIEFIATGNKKQALATLHRQLEQGDDPFYILSMYIYQVRNLLKIAEFYFQGNSSHTEISKIVKLHPFVVQKGMQQLRNLEHGKLKELYKKLEKIDNDAKIGKMDIRVGMDLLIVEA